MCHSKQIRTLWLSISLCIMGLLLLYANITFADYLVDPSAHWKLDEDKNSDEFSGYFDEITQKYSTCQDDNCPIVDNQPLVDSSLSFNGTDNGINISCDNFMQFPPNTSFSIEFWMRKEIPNSMQEVIVGRDTKNQQAQYSHWWVGVSKDQKARFILLSHDTDADLTEEIYLMGTSDIDDGQWHHIAVVKQDLGNGDGSTNARLYVDGMLEDSESANFTMGFSNPTVGMQIGYLNVNQTPGYHFQGAIDELAIYKTSLEEDTIKQHYENGMKGLGYNTDIAENEAPKITSTAPTTATIGIQYTYLPVANDPEGDLLTWSLADEPVGMTIDSTTGEITWTPGEEVTTSGDVTLTVSDDSQSDSETFTISVTAENNNSAPTITTKAGTTVKAGQTYLYDADASDPDQPPNTLIWSLASEPDGMVVDSATGVVTWRPEEGVNTSGTVALTVSDGTASDTEEFEVTVDGSDSGDEDGNDDGGKGGSGGNGGGGGGGGGCFITATGFSALY
jgi:hypothetical protein